MKVYAEVAKDAERADWETDLDTLHGHLQSRIQKASQPSREDGWLENGLVTEPAIGPACRRALPTFIIAFFSLGHAG